MNALIPGMMIGRFTDEARTNFEGTTVLVRPTGETKTENNVISEEWDFMWMADTWEIEDEHGMPKLKEEGPCCLCTDWFPLS